MTMTPAPLQLTLLLNVLTSTYQTVFYEVTPADGAGDHTRRLPLDHHRQTDGCQPRALAAWDRVRLTCQAWGCASFNASLSGFAATPIR